MTFRGFLIPRYAFLESLLNLKISTIAPKKFHSPFIFCLKNYYYPLIISLILQFQSKPRYFYFRFVNVVQNLHPSRLLLIKLIYYFDSLWKFLFETNIQNKVIIYLLKTCSISRLYNSVLSSFFILLTEEYLNIETLNTELVKMSPPLATNLSVIVTFCGVSNGPIVL